MVVLSTYFAFLMYSVNGRVRIIIQRLRLFCHNIIRDIPIQINNSSAEITLVYIDDVVRTFMKVMDGKLSNAVSLQVEPQYQISVGELAEQLYEFRNSRKSLTTARVGSGLTRALYSTYLSFLPEDSFSYDVPMHSDPRGTFVEMLKTADSGQFSFFYGSSRCYQGRALPSLENRKVSGYQRDGTFQV